MGRAPCWKQLRSLDGKIILDTNHLVGYNNDLNSNDEKEYHFFRREENSRLVRGNGGEMGIHLGASAQTAVLAQ